MATYYVDPINGVDANAGTSFATRWKTLTSGATAARIAPADVIRVIASPDPTSLGQNGTWTDGSANVVLTSAVTADITQATSAWTASTNATTTTSTNRKIGATSSSIAVNATFTTGKAAYLALGSAVDFSAYQQVSFSINMTVGSSSADGDISLRLCSDTAGVTTVNTILIPRTPVTAKWQSFTIDTGGALGASIQSIALYVEVDRGAQTFLLNNILACKASSSADSLSLTSLIGKNSGTEPWLPIQSISGTTVVLDFTPGGTVPNTTLFYSGTTEATTAYKREPIIMPSANTLANSTVWGTITDTGTVGSPITYSGGWNRTDMSTQTGDTYINGLNNQMHGLNITDAAPAKSYIVIEKLNFVRCQSAVYLTVGVSGPNSASNISYTAKDCNANTVGIDLSNQSATTYLFTDLTFTVDNVQGNQSAGIRTSLNWKNTIPINVVYNVVNLNSNATYGFNTVSAPAMNQTLNITNINRNNYGIYHYGAVNSISNITNCSYSINQGIIYDALSSANICNITGTVSNNPFGIVVGTNATNNTFNLNSTVLTANTTNMVSSSVNTVFNNGNYNAEGTKVNVSNVSNSASDILLNNPSNVSTAGFSMGNANFGATKLVIAGLNGNNKDNRIYYATNFGEVTTNTTFHHGTSTISWRMGCGSVGQASPTALFPLTLPVAKIACNTSTLVTASVWVYRTDAGITTKLVCPGGQISGVSTTSATASAAINTWEQLTITFTPTQQGVVELQVQCYGTSIPQYTYVSDFSVSQA